MPEISNEVLAERIDGLTHLVNEKFTVNEQGHAKILEQTTKTNGTVKDLSAWKNKIVGGLVVSNVFIIPVLLWLLYLHMGTK